MSATMTPEDEEITVETSNAAYTSWSESQNIQLTDKLP